MPFDAVQCRIVARTGACDADIPVVLLLMLKHARIPALLLILTSVALFMLILFRTAVPSTERPRPGGSARAQDEIAAGILKEWAAKKYVSLTNAAELREGLEKLNNRFLTDPNMTGEMTYYLTRSFEQFLLAFHAGTLQAYLAFRLPDGVDFVMRPEAEARIKEYFIKSPRFSPVSDEFDVYWHQRYKKGDFIPPDDIQEKFSIYLHDFSGRNFYSNYFSGVSFDEMLIRIDVHTGSPPVPLNKYPFFPAHDPGGFSVSAPFPNIGLLRVGHYATFDYVMSLEAALARQRQVVCANFFLFVRVNYPVNYKPILVRFYWAETLNRWLVEDIVDANIKGGSDYILLL
jgi:hypothetical protein